MGSDTTDSEEEAEAGLEEAEDNAMLDTLDEVVLGRSRSGSVLGPSLAEALKRAQDGKRLIEYDDLPVLWRNNEHIITG
jgi:adiponectin receptor